MLSGRAVAAEEAVAIGLVARVVDDAQLLDAALETARAIAANSPYSIKHTKQLMWANLQASRLEAALELENNVRTVAVLSEYVNEGARDREEGGGGQEGVREGRVRGRR